MNTAVNDTFGCLDRWGAKKIYEYPLVITLRPRPYQKQLPTTQSYKANPAASVLTPASRWHRNQPIAAALSLKQPFSELIFESY